MLPRIGTLMLTGMTLDSQASPMSLVSTCEMTDGSRSELLATAVAPDQYELFLNTGGEPEKAFMDMPEHRFVGERVRIHAGAPQAGVARRLALCLLSFLWCGQASAAPLETMIVCPPTATGTPVVALLRTRPILDSHLYLLSHSGKTEPVFGSAEASRGVGMQVTCVGEQTSVLVFSGEFTANYLQGAAVAFDPVSRRLLRIDFAERNRPHWIGLGPAGMSVIFDNSGHESRSRYLIYTLADAIEESDELPAAATLIELATNKDQAN